MLQTTAATANRASAVRAKVAATAPKRFADASSIMGRSPSAESGGDSVVGTSVTISTSSMMALHWSSSVDLLSGNTAVPGESEVVAAVFSTTTDSFEFAFGVDGRNADSKSESLTGDRPRDVALVNASVDGMMLGVIIVVTSTRSSVAVSSMTVVVLATILVATVLIVVVFGVVNSVSKNVVLVAISVISVLVSSPRLVLVSGGGVVVVGKGFEVEFVVVISLS